jgi:imidazolonepropionase-like amidohydrolase
MRGSWATSGLHHLVDAGLIPEAALTAATLTAGSFLREPLLGTIFPAAPADLVLYREDPSQDLGALETREAVAGDGRLYTEAALDAAVATHEEYVHRWLYDP